MTDLKWSQYDFTKIPLDNIVKVGQRTMSTTRPLIVAGCSFSYSNMEIYKEHGIFAWPRIVAEQLDMELIEISKAGASNTYIENVATDAIIKYKHRDPVVMAYWTQPSRINGHDFFTEWFSVEDFDQRAKGQAMGIPRKDIPYYIVNNSLRSIWRTKNFAEQNDIEFHHDLSGCWFIPFTKDFDAGWKETKDRIRKNWYFQNLEFSMKNLEEGDVYSEIPGDGHPDQDAHEKIANKFIDKYKRKFENKDFIYD